MSYENMTAVLYMRVSTDDKGQRLEVQDMELTAWCEKHKVKILRKFSDEGISGTKDDRPGYQQMIGFIMQYKPNLLVAMSPDRIARSTDIMNDLTKLLKITSTNIRYSNTPIEPETWMGANINFFETSRGEEAISDQSIRIKQGMREAMRNGTRSGRPIGRPTKHMDLDLVFECANKGHSLGQTAKILNYARSTLHKHLKEVGRLQEYYDLERQKTSMSEKLDHLNTMHKKRERSKDVKKEVLSDNDMKVSDREVSE